MIKICVCDDMVKDLEYIEKLAEEFALLHPERPFILYKFQSPYDLLEFIQVKGCFDVFLLDIMMPNMDGIALGKKIRERKEDCEIIYLSSSREYGIDAFGVGASNYLVKPIKKEDFDHALLKVLDRVTLSDHPIMILKSHNGIRKICLRDIIFIESFNHYRLIRLITGESVRTEKTISSLTKELEVYSNFQISHRAYLVNLDYVNGLENKNLFLWGGYTVPVSRNYYNAFKDAYLNHTF